MSMDEFRHVGDQVLTARARPGCESTIEEMLQAIRSLPKPPPVIWRIRHNAPMWWELFRLQFPVLVSTHDGAVDTLYGISVAWVDALPGGLVVGDWTDGSSRVLKPADPPPLPTSPHPLPTALPTAPC